VRKSLAFPGKSVCATNARRGVSSVRCFIEDEGWPLEVGMQKQASNHLKLRRSRAVVVSVEAKGGARLCQVRFKETNESKPLMRCRNLWVANCRSGGNWCLEQTAAMLPPGVTTKRGRSR